MWSYDSREKSNLSLRRSQSEVTQKILYLFASINHALDEKKDIIVTSLYILLGNS